MMQILASELFRQRVDGIRINRKLTCIEMKFTTSNATGGGEAQQSLAIAQIKPSKRSVYPLFYQNCS
jgi:hypothetical protein